MIIAGIVAEYNPFHMGHQYQIQRTRTVLGENCGIVCVMSGDFVQRGEAAVFSKFARAEAAVRCGADLVIELPLPWSVSSAERFARGAVGLLGGLGVVDVLSFGSESGEVPVLEEIAAVLQSPEFDSKIKDSLTQGISYPAAREQALTQMIGDRALFLRGANDNLAAEYLKAIRSAGSSMKPLAIRRLGAGHDALTNGNIRSGADLRRLLFAGEEVYAYLPRAAYEIFRNEQELGRGAVSPERMEPLILSRLRMLPENVFPQLPDAGEGLERKLFAACRVQPTLSDLYDSVKSKRYTHARIRRMTLCAALGITKEHLSESPPYARILAFNDTGSMILKRAKESGELPVLSKPTAVRSMNVKSRMIFELTARAHDLYVLSYQNVQFHAGGQDWQESPRYIAFSQI